RRHRGHDGRFSRRLRLGLLGLLGAGSSLAHAVGHRRAGSGRFRSVTVGLWGPRHRGLLAFARGDQLLPRHGALAAGAEERRALEGRDAGRATATANELGLTALGGRSLWLEGLDAGGLLLGRRSGGVD